MQMRLWSWQWPQRRRNAREVAARQAEAAEQHRARQRALAFARNAAAHHLPEGTTHRQRTPR